MKKKVLIIIALALLVPVIMTACAVPFLTPVGPETSREYNLSGFTKVESGSGFETTITKGESYKVTITTNQNLFSYLDISLSGTTLNLQTRPLTIQSFSILKAEVTMPDLREINFSGGSQGHISGFASGEDFNVSASGGSNININVQVGKITFDISGGSRVEGNVNTGATNISLSGGSNLGIIGTGGETVLNLSGGSRADLQQYSVSNADVTLRDGSNGSVIAGGVLNVNLSGGSHLNYSGSPTLGSVDLTGGSEIQHV
jgi:hypothetical protein